jgi:hypothetical protein
MLSRIEEEKTAHGPALLPHCSRDRNRSSEKIRRPVDQCGNFDIAGAAKRAETAGPAYCLPND